MLGRKLAPREPLEATLKSHESPWDRYAARAASWSQVLMLIVVTYGYIATVRPVFQKEQLAEDLARLELDKVQREKELNGYKSQIQTDQKMIADLALQRDALNTQISALNMDRDRAAEEAISAVHAAEKAKKQVDVARANLNKALSISIDERKKEMTGDFPIPFGTSDYFQHSSKADLFSEKQQAAVAKNLRAEYPNPLATAQEELRSLGDEAKQKGTDLNSQIQRRIEKDFADGLQSRGDSLRCAIPDFELWQSSFIAAIGAAHNHVQDCEDKLWMQRERAEKWTPDEVRQLKHTDFWSEQTKVFRSSCEVGVTFGIQRLFQQKWEEKTKPCLERLLSVDAIVLGSKPAHTLPEIVPVVPPTPIEVESVLKESEQ